MTIWFTSDTHYGHVNLLKPKYSKRGDVFADTEAMTEGMIANWNAKVADKDLVYHLGDFFFCKKLEAFSILQRLKGNKILVYGNHDRVIKKNMVLQDEFMLCTDYLELKVPDTDAPDKLNQRLVLCHFPMVVWNRSHYGTWMLHGHCHGSLQVPPPLDTMRRLDVGVDPNQYAPISYDEVKAKMKDKQSVVLDHHEKKEHKPECLSLHPDPYDERTPVCTCGLQEKLSKSEHDTKLLHIVECNTKS